MARQYKLIKGNPASPTTSVDLIATGATGLIFRRGGSAPPSFPLDLSEGSRIPEVYQLVLKGSSQDNAASQVQTFIKLLRDAHRYHSESWQTEPVMLVQQATSETNTRYALVFAAAELEWPDLFDFPFEGDADLDTIALTLIREHPFRSGGPGQIGTAITLTASNGPASPTRVFVSNFRDTNALTHIYNFDQSLSSFSSNLFGNGSATLFPTGTAAGDIVYVGSTNGPFHLPVFPIGTNRLVATSIDLIVEYWNGSAWTDAAAEATYYPTGTENDLFEVASTHYAIGLGILSSWAATTINGVNANWIRIRIVSVTSLTQRPQLNAAIYTQRSEYVEIPAASLKGDSPPLPLLRIRTPSGGDENPDFRSISRILIGAKSRGLTTFVSRLNAGGDDNPAAWTTAQVTDASSTSNVQSPGGSWSNVTFATDSTMKARVRFTGDDILGDWTGEYLAFVRCEQNGGAAGDVAVRLRTYIGSTAASAPHVNSRKVKTSAQGKGPEVLDLGLLSLPFSRAYAADDLTTTDIIFEIFAERTTGSSTLRIHDLILFPVDEGSVGIEDPVSDVDLGSSALRGDNALDLDAGVIDWRALKYSINTDGDLVPAENWAIQNEPPPLAKTGAATRLYFLFLHYPAGGTWGTAPLVAEIGCFVNVEVFMHYRYGILRGSD